MAIEFESIVSVSGLSGLYRVAANRHNGLIIEDLNTGQRRFAPTRNHQFSLLASIGIYTHEGTEDLKAVFNRMKTSELPLPDANAPEWDLRDYFKKILPDHDEDLVRISDIRKVIKWYGYLSERDLIPTAETEEGVEATEVTEVKPAKEKTAKVKPTKEKTTSEE